MTQPDSQAVRITEEHVEVMRRGAVQSTSLAEAERTHRRLADILALVRSLASGERDTYDTRTQRVVDVAEIENLLGALADKGRPGVPAPDEILRRWLTPQPEREEGT